MSAGTLLAQSVAVVFSAEMRQGDSKSIVEHFAGLGAELYGGSQHPAAPTMAGTLALIDASNPTRRRCQVQFFLVDGNHRGRVAAMVNPRLVDDEGRPLGLLGFFECEDHDDTAYRLLDSGLEWLDRHGCRVVRGPINFSTWHNYRLVTSSKVSGWFPGEPYHHDYYPRLWTAAGFEVAATYSSHWFGEPERGLAQFFRGAASCRAAGYRVRALAGAADLANLFELTAGFAELWMFSPIERDEFDALYTPALVDLVAPHSLVVNAPDGQPVGFLYGLPTTIDGHPAMVAKSLVVVPEHRQRMPYHLLMHTWFEAQQAAGISHLIAALMHRDGVRRGHGWTPGTPEESCLREYAVYERKL